MEDASTGVYKFDSVVRGHHIYKYKTVWTPFIDETLQMAQEDTNTHGKNAVTVIKGGCIVGHIPRQISKILSFSSPSPSHHCNVFETRCLNGLGIFVSFICCTTRCIFVSPCVYMSQAIIWITMVTGWSVVWNCIECNCDHTHV